jgi:predicted GH43/DUF377 family glycosyl hydrolase
MNSPQDITLLHFVTAGVAAILVLILVWEIVGLLFKLIEKSRGRKALLSLNRSPKNPIISPNHMRLWEMEGTFNPGAYLDSAGKFHLLYRAIGGDGVSRIGYASSYDGIHFDRLPYPVFAMSNPRAARAEQSSHEGNPRAVRAEQSSHDGNPRQNIPAHQQVYSFNLYPSGGSWGGTEDPRIVNIDGRIYVTFNAFDGWDFIRIGVISMSERDFQKKTWQWRQPLLISPPGQLNKNWVLFPEKIGGKFAILHSLAPEVLIDYADSLEDLATGKQVIKSRFVQHRRDAWDSRIRGAGPPPIKTDAGWLVIYHATDEREPGKYKIGALLLDIHDPRKIIARGPSPILTPDEWYENDGKPGVVYACGAVTKDDTLYIYYGAGDKRIGVATVSLPKILNWLIKYGKV